MKRRDTNSSGFRPFSPCRQVFFLISSVVARFASVLKGGYDCGHDSGHHSGHHSGKTAHQPFFSLSWLPSFIASRFLFADMVRIMKPMPWRMRSRTLGLFFLMLCQGASELLFILGLTWMGAALTSPEALRQSNVFSAFYAIAPQVGEWSATPRNLLLVAGMFVIMFSAAKNLIAWCTAKLSAQYSEDIAIAAAETIMRRYLYSDYLWHLGKESRATYQKMQWRKHLGHMVTLVLSTYAAIITMTLLFLSMVGQEPVLSGLVLGTTGVAGYFVYAGIKARAESATRVSDIASADENKALYCATQGIREVLLYQRQPVFLGRLKQCAQEAKTSRVFSLLAPTMPTWLLETLGFLMMVCAISYLVLVEKAEIPRIATALSLLLLTAWRVLPYCNRTVGYLVMIRSIRPLALGVIELFESSQAPVLQGREKTLETLQFTSSLTVKDISFTYPGQKSTMLSGITFTLEKGSSLGVIGASGAGKTTLANVLAGLFTTLSGTIAIDGIPLTETTLKAYKKIVGFVPQHPFIFAGTLAENIAFSKWGEPFDKVLVERVCRLASIDFIHDTSKGIDMPVGNGGQGLSGGQIQRVAIARALFAEPHILILDEATSALDHANERHIGQGLLRLKGTLTTIIIAHRLQTVEQCDNLLWLEHGTIRAFGSVQEVLPRYKEAMRLSCHRGECP